jgi:hypothetical protein
MSVKIESKIKFEAEFVERCQALLSEANRFTGGSECTIGEAERLLNLISKLRDSVQFARHAVEYPRPKVGGEVEVFRFASGDVVKGIVIADDGDEIEVNIRERVIPPTPQQIVPGFTITANWEKEQQQWTDWSEEESDETTGNDE